MARLTRYVSAAAVALLLAACDGAGSENTFGPADPSLNGGYGTGSNREGDEGEQGTMTAPAPPETEPTEGDSTSRGGGYGVGSN